MTAGAAFDLNADGATATPRSSGTSSGSTSSPRWSRSPLAAWLGRRALAGTPAAARPDRARPGHRGRSRPSSCSGPAGRWCSGPSPPSSAWSTAAGWGPSRPPPWRPPSSAPSRCWSAPGSASPAEPHRHPPAKGTVMKKQLITADPGALGLSTAVVPAHAGGAVHETCPESYDATEHFAAGEGFCVPWAGSFREVRSGSTSWSPPPGGQVPGETHINGAIAGSVTLTPDDPAPADVLRELPGEGRRRADRDRRGRQRRHAGRAVPPAQHAARHRRLDASTSGWRAR